MAQAPRRQLQSTGQKSIPTSQQLAKKSVYAPSPRVHLLGKVNSKSQKSQGCFKSGYMS